MIDYPLQPRIALTPGTDNLVFPAAQAPSSLAGEIVDRLKEDLGFHALCYSMSLAARWALIGRCNISSKIPEFVLIAAFVASILAPVFERLSHLFHPKTDLSLLAASFTVTISMAKISHMHVSNTEGILFLIAIFPAATIVHQLFEE